MKNHNMQPTNQDLLRAINKIDKRVKGIEINNSLILQSISQFSTETDKRFTRLENGQEEIISRVSNLEVGQEELKDKVSNLESGQEEIKFSLANKANSFDLEELKTKVSLLVSN